jgi:hypothetical protein
MQEQINDNNYSLMTSNEGYNAAGVIQLRLNTEPILDQIHHFLRGTAEYTTIEEIEGQQIPRFVVKQVSEKKANDKGIHAIMGWLRGIFNPQVVQGNFSRADQELNHYLYHLRLDLMDYLMTNLYNFDIKETEYEGIIDMIMSIVKPFFTRTIDDGERKSYSTTMKHSESSSQTTNNKGGWNFRVPGM